MKTYFVISDIHSFYDEMKKALDESGYDKDNENHILIVCGDVFDRGDKTVEVYNFLKSIPSDRKVLIKGNHEELFKELLDKDYPDSYDLHNRTVKTFFHIALEDTSEYDNLYCVDSNEWKSIREKVRNSEVTKWLTSGEWVDYFELGRFIFTHAFIPCREKPNRKYYLTSYNGCPEDLSINTNWRKDATVKEWKDARWMCPPEMFLYGLFNHEVLNNKTLVCGHWHTSDFYRKLENKYDSTIAKTCPIYISTNIVGIDACTAFTGRCNVLVIKEEDINKEIERK